MKDKSWLRNIYVEYQNLVYSVAVSIIKDVQLAEDIVQEVFLTLYFKSGSIRDRNKIKHWLARTTANRAIDYLRRSQKVVALSEDFFIQLPDNTRADPGLEMDKNELAREIHKAINRLPEEMKILVILYYFLELPQKEIAATMGLPQGTVKTRLRRARLSLKGHLLKEENDTATSEKGGVSKNE
jgi:RNA polymerase sigma-70 factor (ECF subfamily)